ncbi:hypothetical protein [Streptomyces sp. NPDC048111]
MLQPLRYAVVVDDQHSQDALQRVASGAARPTSCSTSSGSEP